MKDGVLLRQIISIIDELDFGSYEETHAFGEIYETILKELQSAGSAGEFYTPRAVTEFMAKMIKPQIGETMADFACGTGGFLSSWIKELEAIKDAFDVILMNPPYGGSEKEDIKQNFPADLKSSETAGLFIAVIMYRLKKNGRAAVIIPDGFLFGNDNAKNKSQEKASYRF